MPYETKPMKKQWLEIDGRLTPIILPQIWNHELQDWVVTSEQNPLPTQVYGSNVEEVTAIERGVYSETERRYLDIPDGVIGVFIYARIRSVIGNFSTDEGYKLWTFPIIEPTGVPINHTFEDYAAMSWSTDSEGLSTSPSVYLYPTINEARKSGQQISLPTRVDVGRRIRIDLRISGAFQSGEGIDAEVFVRWLK